MKKWPFIPRVLFSPDTDTSSDGQPADLSPIDFSNPGSYSSESADLTFEQAFHMLDNKGGAGSEGPERPEEGAGLGEQSTKDVADTPSIKAEAEGDAEGEVEYAVEGETGGDGAEAAKAEEEPAIDLSIFGEVLPGAVLEKPQDVIEHIRAYQERDNMLSAFERLVEKTPQLLDIIQAVGEGEPLRTAIATAVEGIEIKEIDPEDDPIAYAEMMAEKARLEERNKLTEAQKAKQEKIERQIAQEAERAFEDFAKRNEMDQEAQARFLETFNSLFQGDPRTGRFRRNAFDIVQRGLNFEKQIVAEREKARKEGFDEGVRSVMKKKKTLPKAPAQITGSRTSPDDSGGSAEAELAKELFGNTGDWYQDAKKKGMVKEVKY